MTATDLVGVGDHQPLLDRLETFSKDYITSPHVRFNPQGQNFLANPHLQITPSPNHPNELCIRSSLILQFITGYFILWTNES